MAGERVEKRVGQPEQRFPSRSGHADKEATEKAGAFTSSALSCRLLPPPPPAGTPAALPGRTAGRVGGEAGGGAGRAERGAAPGRARPAGGLSRGGFGLWAPGSAPGPARPGGGGGNAGASSPRPAAPPPLAAGRVAAAPAAAGSSPPPLFFVRCERRRWCGARAEAPSLPRPLLRGEGPERWCPAPPRPPSVPPALSGSCLLLLLLLPVVQAPPSLLSFAARISLEFYSLPHVTHRVKLHLRRVTHQHSASPSRPGHRQQQPPPTEDSQPGSQPAPPSAECAAAAHGNSRARPGGARAAPPSALEAELAEDLRVPSGTAEGFRGEREGGASSATQPRYLIDLCKIRLHTLISGLRSSLWLEHIYPRELCGPLQLLQVFAHRSPSCSV
ncbi:transcription initiation factor TFIID subunit 4-like [Pseudorca crassidens]|uniref:transcription initiation factor TFIID subunit 4-like n=1 Tax=Pseudorca crassidens TaxID=82174 RepID=UPI00352E08B6